MLQSMTRVFSHTLRPDVLAERIPGGQSSHRKRFGVLTIPSNVKIGSYAQFIITSGLWVRERKIKTLSVCGGVLHI